MKYCETHFECKIIGIYKLGRAQRTHVHADSRSQKAYHAVTVTFTAFKKKYVHKNIFTAELYMFMFRIYIKHLLMKFTFFLRSSTAAVGRKTIPLTT